MSERVIERGFKRREFMAFALALGGTAVAASGFRPSRVLGAASIGPLDPANPDILFGSTSSLWGEQHDIEWAIKRIAGLGLQGIEPYPNQIEKYRSNPRPLKKLFDDAGITLIDVSNGAKGQSTNFIDPDQIPKTIADHVAFARDFLQPFGVNVWKCNMGTGRRVAQATISSRDSPTPSTRSAGKRLPWGSGWLRILISGVPWSASAMSAE